MEIASTKLLLSHVIAVYSLSYGEFLNVDFIWISGIETFLIIIVCLWPF